MDTFVLGTHFAGFPSVTFQLESLALCGEKKKRKGKEKISLGVLKRDEERRGAAIAEARDQSDLPLHKRASGGPFFLAVLQLQLQLLLLLGP